MGSILGGGGKSTSTSQSGYSALSPALQQAFNPIGQALAQYTNPNNPGVQQMFTPMGQTADETTALNRVRQGFTPTAQSLQSDISMLSNPYDQSVIDEINRQAGGDYSILKQNATQAGQFGSNRQALGANDIDMSRLGQINQFKQGQFNNTIDQIFSGLIPQRQADTQNLLGAGGFLRQLDLSQRQAPINALQAGTGMISPFISGGTSNQQNAGQGMLGSLGSLASGLGSAYLAFSDIRLKKDIVRIGEENGYPIYEFTYRYQPGRYIGVMAQDVQKIKPEAVYDTPVGLAVDYGMIGVELRRAA